MNYSSPARSGPIASLGYTQELKILIVYFYLAALHNCMNYSSASNHNSCENTGLDLVLLD